MEKNLPIHIRNKAIAINDKEENIDSSRSPDQNLLL